LFVAYVDGPDALHTLGKSLDLVELGHIGLTTARHRKLTGGGRSAMTNLKRDKFVWYLHYSMSNGIDMAFVYGSVV
jgi:hypothetical protein